MLYLKFYHAYLKNVLQNPLKALHNILKTLAKGPDNRLGSTSLPVRILCEGLGSSGVNKLSNSGIYFIGKIYVGLRN